ncbi:MAG: DUF4179 domain-containing protein, partial [Lachnospiraceae bacterium]|nr:DUF4179 domain-containing protein [Lachnospiraceae bacterium]
MGKQYSEQELMDILGRDMAQSDVINQKIQEAYDMIKKQNKRKSGGFQKAGVMAAVAAALVLAFGICAANPVLAAKIPLIGRIFQIEEKKVSYPGNYSEKAERLSKADENGTEAVKEDNRYSQVSGDITFTISECYA